MKKLQCIKLIGIMIWHNYQNYLLFFKIHLFFFIIILKLVQLLIQDFLIIIAAELLEIFENVEKKI